jgi:hypothetical protein
VLLYHGTSAATARKLVSRPAIVSVQVGGGELGRGFYAGEHVALAAAWARGRGNPGVLEIEVANANYAALAIKVLSWPQVVSTWNQLRVAQATRTHIFGWDVVHGPLATMQHAIQHKFESAAAAAVLHKSTWVSCEQIHGTNPGISNEASYGRAVSRGVASR